MPRNTKLELLPFRNETWYVHFWKARLWITPPGEEPYRPHACMVLNLDRELVQNIEMFDTEPSPDQAFDLLATAMRKPNRKIGARSGRPARILFEDEAKAAALSDRLKPLGIISGTAPLPEIAVYMAADLDGYMGGFSALPGLLSVEEVTQELVAGFFAAAAALIDAEPWIRISDEHKFAVKIPQDGQARILALMGYAGMEYGIASYLRWEDVENFYRHTSDPLRAIPEDGSRSVFFHPALETPIDDLEAAAQHGWELSRRGLYPVPLTFFRETETKGVARPSPADLVFYEAAFRALLVFIDQHLQETGRDAFQPVEADVRVPTHAGELTVHVRYPAGTLSADLKSSGRRSRTTESAGFDRRLMEKAMRGITGGFADPDLEKAQQVMYQAFEETNPRKRIALAYQALSISPDCADAFVLLAEEEAETDAEALSLYEKGIAAGRRALAGDYEDLAGHFWMALETRPYMRALAGQANMLWSLGQEEAAVRSYSELLDLNPGDNQGVRYSLVQLLLDMGRDEEAAALLDEFSDDASADFLYTRVLLAFRQSGPGPAVEKLLREAMRFNAWVPDLLSGENKIPGERAEFLTLGGEDEAASYASHNISHWRRTSGALDWLKTVTGRNSPAKPKKPTKRGRRQAG